MLCKTKRDQKILRYLIERIAEDDMFSAGNDHDIKECQWEFLALRIFQNLPIFPILVQRSLDVKVVWKCSRANNNQEGVE